MVQLHELIGRECDVAQVARVIRLTADSFEMPVVGAYHITCSDETEWEVAEAFHQLFGQELLPPLKGERRSVFRTMNLGGRYEPGAMRIAEGRYAIGDAPGATRLIVVKVNSHVGLRAVPGEIYHGELNRYGLVSSCCGALVAMLNGTDLPAAKKLEAMFGHDGHDRLAELRDPLRVAAEHKVLLAAVVNARLQAAAAVEDLVGRQPSRPAVFLVIPCVTVNRTVEPNTEIVIGQYGVDWTTSTPEVKYSGLGDLPCAYRVQRDAGRLTIQDNQWSVVAPEEA